VYWEARRGAFSLDPAVILYRDVGPFSSNDSTYLLRAVYDSDPAGISSIEFRFDSLRRGAQQLRYAEFCRNALDTCTYCGTVDIRSLDSRISHSGNVYVRIRGTFAFQASTESGAGVDVSDGRFYVHDGGF
jgi:hypothetical protein